MNERKSPASQPTAPPWWRVPMMWLVVGGPLLVVIAATVTAVIAIRGADVIVEDRAASAVGPSDAQAPALKARNHAATSRGP